MTSRKPRLEPLESRRLLTGDWHNSGLRCDVDGGGLVNANDVLLVVNDINASGSRELAARNGLQTPPYLDVSGDDFVSPIDVLIVVNAINNAPHSIAVALQTDIANDPNGNGIVLVDQVSLLGQTSAHAKVTLSSDRADEPLVGDWNIQVDHSGQFAFAVPMQIGVNRLQVDFLAELRRTKPVVRELRRGDIITDWNAAAINVVRDWSTSTASFFREFYRFHGIPL